METKTYTYLEKDAERHNGWQVMLVLKPESNGFVLTCGVYSSDWGDRHEKSTRYYGVYEEDDAQIVCKTHQREKMDHRERHEESDGYENRSWEYNAIQFTFKKQERGLVCAIDFESALGKVLSSEVEPIKLFQ